jgi:hypothetical protein
MCKPISDQQAIAGEDCKSTAKGIYFINTNPISPFALGRITDLTRTKSLNTVSFSPVRNVDPFLKQIDTFGKLEGNFNNLAYPKSNYDDDLYFSNHGSDEIAHKYLKELRSESSSNKKFMNVKMRKSSKLLKLLTNV